MSTQNEYQHTLNLPETSFSMRAGLAQKEPEMLAEWDRQRLYDRICEKTQGAAPFVLHDGPPYANGNIHIGHALNKILKDIIVKMKTMQGHHAVYVPGWDCHGLPIEHQLFKQMKKRKSEVSSVEFRKEAHGYAMRFVDVQREQFRRLGVFAMWDNPYLTLTPEYEYWILQSFASLVKEGYVYRGLKPVNWCADCETALAEAEVEYEDHTSPSVYVRFRLEPGGKMLSVGADKPVSLLIWTTTPWTLLANVAVAVHPQFDYVFVDVGDEILVVEKTLHERVLAKKGIVPGRIAATFRGVELKGLRYEHPFGVKTNCCVITAEHVTREDGTGLVHTAPGHGQEDYEAGRDYHLDILMPVDDRGCFDQTAAAFAGINVFKANPMIVEDLERRGILFASEKIAHSYPHCWRCKKPVIFRATKQWFLKIDHHGLRKRLQEVIRDEVAWIPASGRERITGMVIGRPDWCLSRQRHWGVPIPALKCVGSDGEHRVYPEVVERFAEIAREEGSDSWFTKDLAEILPEGFVCPETGCRDFEKTYDILDVWFDSGVSHRAVVGPMIGESLPADLYLEGSDQHRGWFQSSLIPAVAMTGQAPFKSVLTHGFVVDGEGRKMSKSLGNVIGPDEMTGQYGADILRLWVAASNYSEDIRLSKEIVARDIDAYRKIRNTFRYLLGNLSDFKPDHDIVDYEKLLPLDQWALNRLYRAVTAVQTAYNQYDFSQVYQVIYAFCNEDLSSFYLDILKDRLYTSQAAALPRRSAQTVLYYMVNYLVRLLAPILVFTAEEIFQAMPKDSGTRGAPSVHLLAWEAMPEAWDHGAVEDDFRLLVALRPFVMKALEEARAQGLIGSSLEAKVIIQTASAGDAAYLKERLEDLPAVFIVSQVEVEGMSLGGERGLGDAFPETRVVIARADGEKCARCWNYRPLGAAAGHPRLCQRCAEAVVAGEKKGVC